tara:strand:- start:297 stop:1256 length:960 start_codon:yes stop_codon:yes gene_type:complete
MREQASYKLLGGEAAEKVKGMSDQGGHGASHVFSVTREAQEITARRPLKTRRQTTIGALLHDVAREPEGVARKALGKPRFKKTPEVWHSELGGHAAKDFIRKRKHYAKNVPGMEAGEISNIVRAHDTDVHAVLPWTKEQVFGHKANPASRALYLADKKEGLGVIGAERTIQMAKKFNETSRGTRAVVERNLVKYDNMISNLAKEPSTRVRYIRDRKIYHGTMKAYLRKKTRVEFLEHAAAAKMTTPAMKKTAFVFNKISTIQRLLKWGIQRHIRPETFQKMLKRLGASKADIFEAIEALPPDERARVLIKLKEGTGVFW